MSAAACNTPEGDASRLAERAQMAVGIEVTRHCNLRCPHCFTSSGSDVTSDPTSDQLQQLLTQLAAAGIRSVAFSGGEPLIRNDLARLLHHAKNAGIEDLGLVTNGYYVTPALARELRGAGLRTVQVSLDGVDATDHGAVRECQAADYYRAVRALRLFMDVGLSVYAATVICPRNVQRAPEMALFCEALGLNGLRYCTFVPTGRAAAQQVAKRFAVEPEKLDAFLAFVRQMNQQPGARLAVSIDHSMGPWQTGDEFHCESGKRVAYVSCSGHLYPCPALSYEPLSAGNVFESPVGQLLASPALAVARCIPKRQIEGRCAACTNRHCSGGCRGIAYALAGNLHGAVSYCNFRRSAPQRA